MEETSNTIPEIGADAFLAALPVPALLLDAGRALVTANRAARNTFRLADPGEDLTHSFRNPEILAAVDHVLKSGDNLATEVQMGSAPVLTYQVNVSALETAAGRHVLMIFVDMTSARQAEAVRSAFVANVSHELRSPLTTLMGAAEALGGPAQEDAEGRNRMLALMGQEARRMKNLIDDLLSLSRVEAQEYIAPGQKVDLRPLLEGARERFADRAATRDMAIEINIAEDLPKVAGVDDELFQVFDNLVSNALKYGTRGTRVSVSAEHKDTKVRVAVHNEGPPIPPEHLPRLTERFYRVDKSRSRELGGTGLGLAIVKHIVNRHRGKLAVESAEGMGTTFRVDLPVA